MTLLYCSTPLELLLQLYLEIGFSIGWFRTQHRTFHRDYDAPKDMNVDSILCAPIILHYRVIGVIQVSASVRVREHAAVQLRSHASTTTYTHSYCTLTNTHLTLAIVQLINRIDLESNGSAVDEDATPPPSSTGSSAHSSRTARNGARSLSRPGDDEREVKLRRLKSVKLCAPIGFSAKDEQKLIQFASRTAVRTPPACGSSMRPCGPVPLWRCRCRYYRD